MGGRSFLVEIRDVSDLDTVEKWGRIVSNLANWVDEAAREEADAFGCTQSFDTGQRTAELCSIINLVKKGKFIVDEKQIKDGLGDFDLSPCGFTYYCGRVWLCISTHTVGEPVV